MANIIFLISYYLYIVKIEGKNMEISKVNGISPNTSFKRASFGSETQTAVQGETKTTEHIVETLTALGAIGAAIFALKSGKTKAAKEAAEKLAREAAEKAAREAAEKAAKETTKETIKVVKTVSDETKQEVNKAVEELKKSPQDYQEIKRATKRHKTHAGKKYVTKEFRKVEDARLNNIKQTKTALYDAEGAIHGHLNEISKVRDQVRNAKSSDKVADFFKDALKLVDNSQIELEKARKHAEILKNDESKRALATAEKNANKIKVLCDEVFNSGNKKLDDILKKVENTKKFNESHTSEQLEKQAEKNAVAQQRKEVRIEKREANKAKNVRGEDKKNTLELKMQKSYQKKSEDELIKLLDSPEKNVREYAAAELTRRGSY